MEAPARSFLVTAGNTREAIDLVRDWGNIFTGNTGFDIAVALSAMGAVDLLTSNAGHREQAARPGGPGHGRITGHAFTNHANLRAQLAGLMQSRRYDAVFMSAAVSDYRPAGAFQVLERRPATAADGSALEVWQVRNVQAGKVKSSHGQIAILGEQTEKLVDLFRGEWGYQGLLFKFKLEVGLTQEALLDIARKSRTASGADYLVANTLEMVRGETPGAYLVSPAGEEWVARRDLAAKLAALTRDRLGL